MRLAIQGDEKGRLIVTSVCVSLATGRDSVAAFSLADLCAIIKYFHNTARLREG